nr:AAC(3) family N-acetyltransferase [Actinophytocola sp.]
MHGVPSRRVPGADADHRARRRGADGRRWVTFTDVATDSDDFADLGEDFEHTGAVTKGMVGQAVSRLFAADKAVAHAVAWFPLNRKPA